MMRSTETDHACSPDERPRMPGSPATPYHPPRRRAAYAAIGLFIACSRQQPGDDPRRWRSRRERRERRGSRRDLLWSNNGRHGLPQRTGDSTRSASPLSGKSGYREVALSRGNSVALECPTATSLKRSRSAIGLEVAPACVATAEELSRLPVLSPRATGISLAPCDVGSEVLYV